jgi:hypothetical protein
MSARPWLLTISVFLAVAVADVFVREVIVLPEAAGRLAERAESSEMIERVANQRRLSVIYDVLPAFDEVCEFCYNRGMFQRAESILSGEEYDSTIAQYSILETCIEPDCKQLPHSKLYYRTFGPVAVPPRTHILTCSDERILYYLARFCEGAVTRGGDIETASWELQLEPAIFDIGTRAFGEGDMKSTMAIAIDRIRGVCTNIDRLPTVSVVGCRN